jgi:hypothetical protein
MMSAIIAKHFNAWPTPHRRHPSIGARKKRKNSTSFGGWRMSKKKDFDRFATMIAIMKKQAGFPLQLQKSL